MLTIHEQDNRSATITLIPYSGEMSAATDLHRGPYKLHDLTTYIPFDPILSTYHNAEVRDLDV